MGGPGSHTGVGRHAGAERKMREGGRKEGLVGAQQFGAQQLPYDCDFLPSCLPACLARQIAPQSAQQSEGIPRHTFEGFIASVAV